MLREFFVILLGSIFLLFASVTNADSNFVNQPNVQSFINHMVNKHHFNRAELISLFEHVKIRPRIMQSIRKPLEAQPWSSYQSVFINESHIRQGVEFWNRHQAVLERAEKIYGVPASIIVATIGVETKYGKNKGEYPVIEALANIAFSKTARSNYFKQELEEFLLLSREQHLNPARIMGSYAGAIGQPQFMPSSYRNYAVNFSGNQHIDLSNNIADIVGSIANYYKKHGWKSHQPVVIQTMVEQSRYKYLINNKPKKSFSSALLNHYGLYPYDKIQPNQKVKIIQLQGKKGEEFWVGLNNFDVIKRYNPSNLYAMAVYQLSDYIAALREKLNHG